MTLENSTEELYGVHEYRVCAGRTCPLHNRSDHLMRDFPQHWREDTKVMERICTHGVGHPDPDQPFSPNDHRWLHGCDGCCGMKALWLEEK